MANTTTLVVQFGTPDSEADAYLSAEIDDRETGLNGGETSFEPGETAYFLVYKSDNVTLRTNPGPIASAGNAAYATQTIDIDIEDEDITFAASAEGQLDVPCKNAALTSYAWVGDVLGTPSLGADRRTVTITPAAGKDLKNSAGVLRVNYTAEALPGSIVSPPSIATSSGETLTDFSIVVLIIGDVA